MVYESRSLIPQDLKDRLLAEVAMLESIPDDEKDWHPGTDQQVLDLVHPSLYFLRVGHTYVLCEDSSGSLTTRVLTRAEYMQGLDISPEDEWAISEIHQWLPTDFEVSPTGQIRPLGYINNLHPIQYREAYTTLSSILGRFLPLFERVVSDSLSPRRPYAIEIDGLEWYASIPEPDLKAPQEEWDEWEREQHWPVIPDPSPFQPPDSQSRVELNLRGRTLQVIVKLANIVLSPNNPTYDGGSWHVEGMANEHIVATGLYYYKCDNITESKLAFRAAVGRQDPYEMLELHEQWDNKGCLTAWGIGEGSLLNQELGHVVAEEGKCIAFPNVYQHCVQPFELADPSKPGYRKILCFFLVDPLKRIISTSDVPPQQESWWRSESWSQIAFAAVPPLRNIPPELYDEIITHTCEGTISRAEAERWREAFMDERSDFADYHSGQNFELEWNMCEH